MQIDYYFDSLVSPLPDSICVEIDRLLCRPISTDLRDFILWHLLERYESPDYMTQDRVFIYLYDKYFSQLKIKDLNKRNLTMIADKAKRLRRLQMFYVAPDFSGKGVNGQPFNLLQIESQNVVLLFFDHDCFVCNEELDELEKMNLKGTSIVAIDTNPNSQLFDNEFININAIDINTDIVELYDIQSTPLIYVLDSEKRIIAKKIRASQINLILSSD